MYVGTLIDAWFLRQKVFTKVTVNCRPLHSFFLLLPCLKPQNESQPVKLKRKRYYVGQSEQMFDKLNQNKTNLADQRLLTITLIVTFGFMKFSEVSRLRRSDLVFSSTYVKAFIEKIKTNIGKECGFTS